MVNSENGLTRDELVRHAEVATGSKNAYGAVASLMSNRGNAYEQVLEVEGKCISKERRCPSPLWNKTKKTKERNLNLRASLRKNTTAPDCFYLKIQPNLGSPGRLRPTPVFSSARLRMSLREKFRHADCHEVQGFTETKIHDPHAALLI